MKQAEIIDRPVVYKVEQVAEILYCDPSTVYRLIRDDRLKAIRLGRVLRVLKSDLDEFMGMAS